MKFRNCKWLVGFIAVIMTLSLMVVPSLAVEDLTLNANSVTISMGNQFQMEATLNGVAVDATWTSGNTGIASVSNQYGVVSTYYTAGTATITGTYVDENNVEHTGSCVVTVTATTAYGYQGLNNTIRLANPAYTNVTVDNYLLTGTPSTSKFENSIAPGTVAATLSGGEYHFGFNMSAGTNNFQPSLFAGYNLAQGEIKIKNKTTGDEITYANGKLLFNTDSPSSDFDSTTKVITLRVDSTDMPAGNYQLIFDHSVCGNNETKTLGAMLYFDFTV